ncbi:MAG: 4'-phosphopantetheinyl transferase superfamily protein [Myxococcaceae bacterium]
MAVGNDVVDLCDEAIATSHLRPRFVAKVLTASEKARLEHAPDPKALLWAHFALKEAAYKAVSQVRPPPGAAYHHFEVAEDLRSVRFEDLQLHARVEVTAERVHAVAWLGDEPELTHVQSIEQGADASASARAALCAALAARLGCPAEQLAVVRDPAPGSWDGFGPPRVEREGNPLPAQLSLSHDGRFISYAARQKLLSDAPAA